MDCGSAGASPSQKAQGWVAVGGRANVLVGQHLWFRDAWQEYGRLT